MTVSTVKSGKIVNAQAAPAFDGLVAFQEVVGAINTWVEVHEREQTKRTGIAARESVALAEIAAKRDLFLTYLNRSFDERETAFTHLFATLDGALASGSTDLGPILGAITALAAKSPFTDLHDIQMVKESLADPDHEWVV